MTVDFPQPARWPLFIGGLIVGAAIAAGALWAATRNDDTNPEVDTAGVQTELVVAESRDLITHIEFDATLAAGVRATIASSAPGTITRVGAEGTAIAAGDVVAEVDGAPVVALYGTVPMFRPLSEATDDGADIEQLERNLVALGYDPDGTVTVDQHFTFNTGLMVERWEEDLNIDADYTVELGRIAFISGPAEIVSTGVVGAQAGPGQPILQIDVIAESGFASAPFTATTLGDMPAVGIEVTDGSVLLALDDTPIVAGADDPDGGEINVPATSVIVEHYPQVDGFIEQGRPLFRYELRQGSISLPIAVAESDTLAVGDTVEVELPDENLIEAVVTEKSDVARTLPNAGGPNSTVVDLTLQPVDSLPDALTAGPVIVRTIDESITNATMVPSRALVALAEGGHAVEIEGLGLVSVDLGAFDDGWVQITNGAVAPGDSILAPT
ncbi:MAG: hypothetical protein ACR2P0_08220 [Acidimicrobiales bacterium]